MATQLASDSGLVSSTNSAIAQGQATLDTASTAMSSIITTINSIETALTAAQLPGATLANLNATLATLGQGLTDAVTGATFNGSNLLDGSQIGATAGTVTFASGFNAAAAVNNITTISATTQTVYDSNGASGLLVQSGTTNIAGSYDLTKLGSSSGVTITATNAADALTAVTAALTAITTYSASIGGTQNRLTNAATLNTAITTNYQTAIGSLVDADMSQASARLQALQTQEQLGIQSLAIANQNGALILKLFGL